MLNDPCCESVLLDVGEDAMVGSGLPALYLDITGKHHDYILSIVGNEYSGSVRYATGEAWMTVEEGTGAWGLQELLNEIKTRLWEES